MNENNGGRGEKTKVSATTGKGRKVIRSLLVHTEIDAKGALLTTPPEHLST